MDMIVLMLDSMSLSCTFRSVRDCDISGAVRDWTLDTPAGVTINSLRHASLDSFLKTKTDK